MNVGICGLGVTGSALYEYLEQKTKFNIFRNDPRLGYNDNLINCNVVFICVPVPTNHEKGQDLSMVKDCIKKCSDDALIVIRSTVLPGTTASLAKFYDREIVHIPEFLTARQAVQDQFDQKVLYVGTNTVDENFPRLFKSLFPEKTVRFVASGEAEMIKYAHNCFGAMKVTYWNAVFEYCQKMNLNYEFVRSGCFSVTDFINPKHTQVPGPDGLKGFGGTCFPVNIDGAASVKEAFGFRMFAKFIRDLNRIYRKGENGQR